MSDLQKWAERLLPPQAQEIELLAKNESPFTLGARSSQEFTFTFLLGGRRFTKSIALVDLDPRQRSSRDRQCPCGRL